MTDQHNHLLGNPDFSEGNQTIEVGGVAMPTFAGVIWRKWREAAATKGFDILARVMDRYHLVLRCHICGGLTVVKVFVVMNNTPLCEGCLYDKKLSDAEAAGLKFLGRDVTDRHYAFYTSPCGHEVRRQFEFIIRVGTGAVDLRCETCQLAREQVEAAAFQWELVGPDQKGNQNYRMYRHLEKDCNHVQRIARANLQSGRFSCNACCDNWLTQPSALYLMKFHMPDRDPVLKMGFSNYPAGRLAYQLRLRDDLHAEVLREVPMPTGHKALRAEKKLHTHLKKAWPEHVVHPDVFAGVINVVSEIYELPLLSQIHQLFNELESGQSSQAA